MNFRWTLKNNEEKCIVSEISQKLKIPTSLARILSSRGFASAEQVDTFFNPSLDKMYDPFIMKDMDKASDRILQGIERNEQIWIHGDYDVDGTCSAAMLTLFLREIGGNVDYYIPDRFSDGYGINSTSIEQAVKKNVKLLITVDVGITSFDMLDLAAEKNIETIVCDHHEPSNVLPKAFAILDPFLPDCTYPFKPLAACGVVFKLMQALAIKIGKPDLPHKHLDFVALAATADMVPLLDENRIMVHYGLKQINKNPRIGFQSLMYCAGLKQGKITTSNIVYAIAPIINAAGRLGQARRSVEMMIQNSEITSFRIAQQLEDENRKRRVFDQELLNLVLPLAQKQIDEGRHSLVIYGENWHAGVVGIVTSRLVDRFHLPTILLTKIEDKAKGSARSINFDIHSALKKLNGLLLEFGGHKHAAGLSLDVDKIDEFREHFDEIARDSIPNDMLTPELEIDAEINFSELSPNFFRLINKFAPFGFANPKPLFLSSNVKCLNVINYIGSSGLRFRAIQDNFVINAVIQNMPDKIKIIRSGQPFSMVYSIETHSYNGQISPQLSIKDIKKEADKKL